MANKEENHALVADDEAPTEFAFMAKSSSSSENKRTDKNKEGLGYSVVPPPSQVYSLLKKDMSWTGLPKFADDTITDYSRPSPSIESNTSDLQNTDSPTVIKTNKVETDRKSFIKYAEMYRNTSKSPKVRGKSAVRTQFRVPRVSTVTKNFPLLTQNFPLLSLLVWETRENLLRPQLVRFEDLNKALLTKRVWYVLIAIELGKGVSSADSGSSSYSKGVSRWEICLHANFRSPLNVDCIDFEIEETFIDGTCLIKFWKQTHALLIDSSTHCLNQRIMSLRDEVRPAGKNGEGNRILKTDRTGKRVFP
nr:hypothetical protein [Tanacetum cinerariifolium]